MKYESLAPPKEESKPTRLIQLQKKGRRARSDGKVLFFALL